MLELENIPSSGGKSTQKRQRKTTVASNSVRLDSKNPIPIEFNSNIFVSLKGKKYVPFLNPMDHFGQLLTEAKLLSATTLACVSSKAKYCAGHGLISAKDKKDKIWDAWSRSVNRKQDSLYDVMLKALDEVLTVGNSYIRVIRGEIGGKRFVKVYNVPYMDCRLSYPDMDDICNSVYVSKYFRKQGMWSMQSNKTEELPIWTPNMFENPWTYDDSKFQHTMFHLKNDMAGYDYYGMPSNIASLPQQVLEYKAARYNLDQFDNNLVIGGLVIVKGAIPDADREAIAKDIVFTHTGDGKQGRYIVLSSESGLGDGVEVKEFSTQKDGSFVESDAHNTEKIYISNQWNKLLIGGSESKNIGSGNSAYIRGVFDIANETVIMPEQARLMNKFMGPLLDICDEWMGTDFAGLELGIKQMQPVTFLGDLDVNAIITKDEARKIAGMPPFEDAEQGKEFVKTGKSNDNNQQPKPDVQDQ